MYSLPRHPGTINAYLGYGDIEDYLKIQDGVQQHVNCKNVLQAYELITSTFQFQNIQSPPKGGPYLVLPGTALGGLEVTLHEGPLPPSPKEGELYKLGNKCDLGDGYTKITKLEPERGTN